MVCAETVKYFNNEGLERSKYNDLIDTYQDYSYKMQTSLIWLDILQEAIVYSGTVIGILVCAKVCRSSLPVPGVYCINAGMRSTHPTNLTAAQFCSYCTVEICGFGTVEISGV